jgi:hypothetical protein
VGDMCAGIFTVFGRLTAGHCTLGYGSRAWAQNFGVRGSGFGVRGSGFGVQGSGFGVWGSGFGVRGSGFGVRGSEFGVLQETMDLIGGRGSRPSLQKST